MVKNKYRKVSPSAPAYAASTFTDFPCVASFHLLHFYLSLINMGFSFSRVPPSATDRVALECESLERVVRVLAQGEGAQGVRERERERAKGRKE